MAARTVVVTGGSSGIGLATARAFVESDADVVITGRRADRLADAIAELGSGARSVTFDAADPDAVARALERLPDRVDVLVNNAGGNVDLQREPPPTGDLRALAASWHANLDANLLSAARNHGQRRIARTGDRDRVLPRTAE